jgi:hypothetical protein
MSILPLPKEAVACEARAMYFDDFIAHQVMRTTAPSSSHHAGTPQPTRRLLRGLWSGVRQLAWGIDAGSSVRHGIEVPPDHGARSRPRRRL